MNNGCPDGVLIPVSALVVWGVLGPCRKGVPITPHYLRIDIALDISVLTDSDSILNCPTSLLLDVTQTLRDSILIFYVISDT